MDVKERIDSLLQEHIQLTKQIERTEARMNAQVAVLRQDIKEVTWSFKEELEKLKNRRNKIRDEILNLWKEHFDTEVTVTFPSAMVSRRNFRELIIHDKIALVNALDRIGRLDLVDYVFKENEVARLYAEGKLKGLNKKAVEIVDHYNLQVRPNKEKT
jgi:cell division protein FtsB